MAEVILSKETRKDEICFMLSADEDCIFKVTFIGETDCEVIVEFMDGHMFYFYPMILPRQFEEEIFRNMIRNETGAVCFHDNLSSTQFLYINHKLLIDYPIKDGSELKTKMIEIPVDKVRYKKETQISTRVYYCGYTDVIVYGFLENGTKEIEIKYEVNTTKFRIPFYSFSITLGREFDFVKTLDYFFTSISKKRRTWSTYVKGYYGLTKSAKSDTTLWSE